jgi:hypothetical protein
VGVTVGVTVGVAVGVGVTVGVGVGFEQELWKVQYLSGKISAGGNNKQPLMYPLSTLRVSVVLSQYVRV